MDKHTQFIPSDCLGDSAWRLATGRRFRLEESLTVAEWEEIERRVDAQIEENCRIADQMFSY